MTISMAELQFDGIDIPGIVHTRLRYSNRAKRMRIEVRADRTLLVVVPAATREDQWLPFLLGRKGWVLKALERLPAEVETPDRHRLPAQIELISLGATYALQHARGAGNRAKLVEDRLMITTREDSVLQARKVLRSWLVQQARSDFSNRLSVLSGRTGLTYGRLSIRGQKTRWGSCSHAGNISLNYKLLFMPSGLVDHVIMHELVHTRHMNHSAGFWALLERHDPATREHKQALRRAGRELPAWLAEL